MAEKLGVASWTAFAKKRELDDPPLVKALNRFDKAGESQHDERLDALKDLIEQLDKSIVALAKRKKELGDKPFAEAKDKLHELREQAEAQQKQTRSAKATAEAEADGEADSPALLTSKMIPLLRELRKPESTMHAMVATAGKLTAVLIMRTPIAAGRRKLLAEFVDAKGGAKYAVGQCLFEHGALSFVIDGAAGGLAKRLRQAVFDQTGMRMNVRVRGEGGEQDQDGDEPAEAPATPAAPGAGKPTGTAPASAKASAPPTAGTPPAPPAQADVQAPTAGAPASPKPRTVAPAILYTQTRLAWVATRGKVQAELKKLESAILAEYQGAPEMAAVTKSVRKLDSVLAMFDTSLVDKLDSALSATDEAEKQRWHGEAREAIARYLGFLSSDPLVQQLDGNPFVPVAVKSTLTTALSTLAAKIV